MCDSRFESEKGPKEQGQSAKLSSENCKCGKLFWDQERLQLHSFPEAECFLEETMAAALRVQSSV